MVVGYALTCKMQLPAIAATIEEARYQARKSSRDCIIATDIRTALLEYQIPSDEALQNAFQPEQSPPRAPLKPATMLLRRLESALHRRCNSAAE